MTVSCHFSPTCWALSWGFPQISKTPKWFTWEQGAQKPWLGTYSQKSFVFHSEFHASLYHSATTHLKVIPQLSVAAALQQQPQQHNLANIFHHTHIHPFCCSFTKEEIPDQAETLQDSRQDVQGWKKGFWLDTWLMPADSVTFIKWKKLKVTSPWVVAGFFSSKTLEARISVPW